MPADAMTLGRWPSDGALAHPGRVAILDRGVAVTYAELEARATSLASALDAAGHGRGSRIATLSGSTADQVVLLFACAKVGAALAPLSWRLRPGELAPLLRRIEPDLLLVEDEFRTLAAAAQRTAGTDVPTTTLGAGGVEDAVPAARTLHGEAGARDDDALLLLPTSGTTGASRIVVLSHAACTWTNLALATVLPVHADDIVLQVLPQHHVAGWNVQPLLAWWHGATVVLERTFDAGRALALIERHGVTTTMGVPTTYAAMAEHGDFAVRDVSTLRSAVVGGATAPERTLAAWARRGIRLLQGYGLTEAGPNVLGTSAGDDPPPGSTGRPYPHVDVALADADGSHLAGPATGELLVRCPALFDGYLGDADATRAVLHGGWLRTGDLARRDEHGWYAVVDRIGDLVRTGAETVAPAEVEAALRAHHHVRDAVVAGRPDERWGEVVVAWIVPAVPVLDVDAVLAAARERIAAFKLPRRIHVVDAVPRTAAGKPLRRLLRDDAAASRIHQEEAS